MIASANRLSHQHHVTSAGFTLIELMVTIAVMAIIVSIATPSISNQLANQRVKSTTATLANALKEAKTESIIRRQPITLSYDNNSNPRLIKIEDTNSAPNLIASYSYDIKSTIKIAPTSITFQPSKVVSAAATYTICDTNTAAIPRQVSISKIAVISIKPVGSERC